jgi:GNAT superfamily N-acetyltransferase
MVATIRRADRPGDLGWMVMAHGEMYAAEYDWDVDFERMVLGIVADLGANPDRPGQRAWIAELDGRRVGCIACVPDAARGEVAVLRILLVDPAARGHGVGRDLVRACVDFARSSGFAAMRLWTDNQLAAARHLYEDAGFTVVDEESHHSFGHDLVGQNWSLELAPGSLPDAIGRRP